LGEFNLFHVDWRTRFSTCGESDESGFKFIVPYFIEYYAEEYCLLSRASFIFCTIDVSLLLWSAIARSQIGVFSNYWEELFKILDTIGRRLIGQ
jgi:hypothetical protein